MGRQPNRSPRRPHEEGVSNYSPVGFNATEFAEFSDLDQQGSMNLRRRSAPLCHRYGDSRERHTMNNTRTAWPGTERLEVSEIPAETGYSILNIVRFFHAKLTQPVSIGFFRRPGCTADLGAAGVFIAVGSPSALRRARRGKDKDHRPGRRFVFDRKRQRNGKKTAEWTIAETENTTRNLTTTEPQGAANSVFRV